MITSLAAQTTCRVAQAADAEERDQIAELAFEVLTDNTSGRKYPMDDLIEMIYHHKGNKRRLADALLEAFVEAGGYKGLDMRDEDFEEDPIKLAFRAMGEDVARAHRNH